MFHPTIETGTSAHTRTHTHTHTKPLPLSFFFLFYSLILFVSVCPIPSCFQKVDQHPATTTVFSTTLFTIPLRPPFLKLFYLDAMGLCISSEEREERAHSQRIDKAIEEDSKRLKRECKLLLLGKVQALNSCSSSSSSSSNNN